MTITPAKNVKGSPYVDQRDRIAGDPTVIISGGPHFLGALIPDGPELILMHEIVGHALPIIRGKMNGNAIDNENAIRAQINVNLRKPDPDHKESNFGG